MTEEQIRQLAKEEFEKNIKNNLDSALIFTYVSELEKEIERLNHECDTYLKIATKRKNIIDELEKYISQEWYCFDNESVEFVVAKNILNKLKELKENKKESKEENK